MNGKDFAIGILSVTAVILLAAIMIVQVMPAQPVMAAGTAVTAGRYTVTTAQLDDTSDLIYVVDTTTRTMNIYGFAPALGQLQLIQRMDVHRQQPAQVPPPRR